MREIRYTSWKLMVHFVEVDGASMPLMELSLGNGFASSST